MEWMAESPEIARENFYVFAKINAGIARCAGCSREMTEFQDRSLN